jgi:hypothetical protein
VRQTPVTVAVRRAEDEWCYTRRVGKIVTHQYFVAAPLKPHIVEVLRHEPTSFEQAYEADQ